MRAVSSLFATASVLCLAAAALAASGARAQDSPPPPGYAAQAGGAVTIVVAPPPPPGYAPAEIGQGPGVYGGAYEEASPNLRVGALRQELIRVQAQHAEYSIAGPLVVLIVGGATAGIAGATFLFLSWGAALGAASDELDRGRLVSGVLSLVGLVGLVGGLISLHMTISARRPYGLRLREIRRELEGYGVRAGLDVRPLPSGAALVGTLSF